MPSAITSLIQRGILVCSADTSRERALAQVAAVNPDYVVVQRNSDLFYSYPASAWRQKIEAARPGADLVEALELQEFQADTTQPATVEMSAAEISSLVQGAAQDGRGTITILDGGQPVGVITLAALQALLGGDTLSFDLPSGGGSRRRTMRGLPPAPAAVPAPEATAAPSPAPEATAAAPPTAPATRTLRPRADVNFPPEVVAGQDNILSVSVSSVEGASGVALSDISVAADVKAVPIEVYVVAPGFAIDGPNLQKTNLPVDGETEVEFTLRALPTTAASMPVDIRVRFRFEGQFVGQVKVQTVVKQSAGAAAAVVAQPPQNTGLTMVMDSERPDLTIEVNQDGPNAGRFNMYVNSNISGRRYYQKFTGPLEFGDNQTAATYTAALFAGIQSLDAATAEIDLAGIGNTLWNKMPEPFRNEYWDLMHGNPALRSIQIITDEAYIPWELLKPFRIVSGQRADAPFWGESFAIGRWDPARQLPQPLGVKQSSVVVPDYPDPRYKLPFAQLETDILKNVCGAQPVKGARKDVINLLRSGGSQLLHFACHGQYNAQNPDLSQLLMEDAPLSAATIAAAATGIAADRPFVFLNACEVGKEGLALTHLGGWAETFCASGFSGFVGPLWAVDDEVAYKVGEFFYQALKRGATLGEALQTVRKQWKGTSGELQHNPTWLAYSLHCDPMLKVAFTSVS